MTAEAGCELQTFTVTYTLTIGAAECSGNTFVPLTSVTTDQTYIVLHTGNGSTVTNIPATPIGVANDGDCIVTQTLEVRDQLSGDWFEYSTMVTPPAWITNFNPADNSFDINTTDQSLISQTFALRFSTTDDEVPPNSPNSIYDTFAVFFEYECHIDALYMNDNLDLIYYLSATPVSVNTALSFNTRPNCPISVSFEVYHESTSSWIAYDDAASALSPVISSYDGTLGSFVVSTSSTTFAPVTVFYVRETYSSSESLIASGTSIDYFSITIRYDCSDGLLIKTNEVSDETYVDSATAITITPAYSFTRSSATCPLTAVLSIFDTSTNTWVVFSSAAANPDHTWVSTFQATNTASNLDAGITTVHLVGAQVFKPETSFLMKVDVSNADAADPTPISFEFDVTIVDFCKDSVLSFTSSQANLDYIIDAVPNTAAEPVTFPSVATTTDSTRCPISVNLQI